MYVMRRAQFLSAKHDEAHVVRAFSLCPVTHKVLGTSG